MYIEDIIIDNLVINFTILFVTKKVLKLSARNAFLVLGSVLGTISVIFYTIFQIEGVKLLLFKIFVSILMVLVSFNYKSFKSFLLSYFSFLFTTALMGGICFFISFSFGKAVISESGVSYELGLPMGIVVLFIMILSYVLIHFIKSVKSKNYQSDFIYEVKIKNKEKEIKLKAFLDTGNTLKDSKTGKPVFILTYKNFYKLFNVSLEKLLQGKISEKLEDAHYLNVGSVGKSTKMLVFSVDELELKKESQIFKLKKPLLALSYQNLEQKLDCGMLINSSFKEYLI